MLDYHSKSIYGSGATELVGYLGPTVSNLRSAYQSNDSWGGC